MQISMGVDIHNHYVYIRITIILTQELVSCNRITF